jgi:hypothetical protein
LRGSERRGVLFGDDGRFPARKRAPGAPNYARSLRSLTGLLGRSLGRRLRGHPASLRQSITLARARSLARDGTRGILSAAAENQRASAIVLRRGVAGKSEGGLASEFQRATRRPATEQSEGAQLGAPPERAYSRGKTSLRLTAARCRKAESRAVDSTVERD